MGQSQSTPAERIYTAVHSNNVEELQRLCNQHLTGNPEADRQILSHRDSEGRTPLIVAAAKNHHACARVLLTYAHPDLIHFVNTKSEGRGGSALHEAARNRNEAIAELLLSRGANPFVANSVGRTALDEAVLAPAPAIVRAFQQKALWSGQVAVKSLKLAGLSQPYKVRWLCVLPHFPCPKPGSTEPVRKQLWIFKDASAVQPKCCVWLDGSSTCLVTRHEAVLRLHPTHAKPQGDVCTRFDRGFCLFLRPPDTTEAADTHFARFMGLCNLAGPVASSPGTLPHAPMTTTTTSYSDGGVSAHSMLLPPLPSFPSATASQTSSVGYSAPSYPTISPAAPPSTQSYTTGMGPLTQGLQQHTQSPARQGMRAASEPSPLLGTSQGQVVTDAFTGAMVALPGESDQEFAARLASAFSAVDTQPGQDNGLGGRSQQPPQTTPVRHSQPPASVGGAADSSSPVLTMPPGAGNQLFPGGPAEPQTPSAPPVAASALQASPAPPAAPAPAAELSDDELCVICLSARREAGFLHGTTLHMCVCRDCCKMVAPGANCPLCRAPVERVINVF